MADTPPELFELSLHGGAPERRYRRLRPEVERFPWSRFRTPRSSPAALEAARRAWTQAALQEYASADAHASMLRALVRARAPLDLSAVASRFPLDELAHAELCARLATLLGGGAPIRYEPKQLYAERRPGQHPAELEAADIVIWNCCVSESWSHALLTALWHAEKDELFRGVRARIAKDEAVHARFGWIYLDWLAPDLGKAEKDWLGRSAAKAVKAVAAGITATEKMGEEHFEPSSPLGGLGREGYVSLARQALEERVRAPLAERGIST
jgi:hypothetical protein